jgi:hypothetical protein
MRRERSALGVRLTLLVALASSLYAAAGPALGTGAVAGATLPRCRPEGYGLEERGLPRMTHRPDAVKLTAGWLTAKERRRACLLRTTITLRIVGSGSVATTARWHVNSVRQPWSGIVHTWVWRNWCGAGTAGAVTVELGAPSGMTVSERVSAPPACVDAGAASTVADVGTRTRYVARPGNRIPPHILPKGVPPPLPWAVINPKNAWLVSDGYTLVAVYAGSPGVSPSIGRFAIVRQNEIFGIQYYPVDLVDVGHVGAIRITGAPRGRSRETTAQRGTLSFVAADGTRGVLELDRDHVRITARRELASSS